MNEEQEEFNRKADAIAKPAAAAFVGGIVGRGAVTYAGMTAAGMVGSGTGIGAAAGPVGMVFGAIAGLALYGLYRVVQEVAQPPNEPEPEDDDDADLPGVPS